MKNAIIASLLILLALGGCASGPKAVDPSGTDIELKYIGEMEATQRFDPNQTGANPYLTPGSFININKDQYYVIELSITAEKSVTLEVLSLKAKDPEGKEIARFFDWPDFLAYLDSWKEDDHLGDIQKVKASQTYLKSMTLELRKGKKSYIAVLIGKKPIAKNFTVEALVGTGDATRKVTLKVGK